MTFVENSWKQIQTIRANLEMCGFGEQSSVLKEDVFHMIESLRDRGVFDIVMADPPYKASYHNQIVSAFSDTHLIKPEGLLIIEHENNILDL